MSITRCVSCDEDEIARVPDRVMLSQLNAADKPCSRYQDRILYSSTNALHFEARASQVDVQMLDGAGQDG